MQIWRQMDMRALCRGGEGRNLALSEADKPGRGDGPAFQLLQHISGLGPASGPDGAFNSGNEASPEEGLGEPESVAVNAL